MSLGQSPSQKTEKLKLALPRGRYPTPRQTKRLHGKGFQHFIFFVDKEFASCSVPEAPLRLHDEEDLIHSEYAAGSLVWARLTGWPWWPAMVDDCPDTEQYYWLDGFSDIPVNFFLIPLKPY